MLLYQAELSPEVRAAVDDIIGQIEEMETERARDSGSLARLETLEMDGVLDGLNDEADKIGYRALATLITLFTFSGSVACRLTGNNQLSSKSGKAGWRLAISMFFTNLIGNMLKGNWREVSSHRQQACVLLCYVLMTALSDAVAYQIPSDEPQDIPYFGEMLILSLATVFGYACKMMAYANVGQKTYSRGPLTAKEKLSSGQIVRRQGLSFALIGGATAVTATVNQILGLKNPTTLVINNGFGKGFLTIGKSLLKVFHTKKAQRLVLGAMLGTTAVISSAVGGIFPFNPSQSSSLFNTAAEAAVHYPGPTTGVAGSGILTNLLLRVKAKDPNKKEKPARTQPKIKTISNKKAALSSALFAGTNTLSAVGYGLNEGLNNGSGTIDLMTKMCEDGWSKHQVRELNKRSKTPTHTVALITAALFTTTIIELISLYTDPSRAGETGLSGMRVLAIGGFGIAGTFGGKLVRNQLLQKRH